MRIPPYLLDGAPGLGKTAFCIALAKALKLPFVKLSAGGMQAGAILAGTASHWSNSQTGEVFNLLAHQSTSSGCAVLLIDEVDKLVNYGDGHNCIPALLDLLEPESARVYRDESLCMNFDASHLIIILTCNYPEDIEPALLSRCKIRTIEAPGMEQKVAIANEIHNEINASLPKSKRTVLDKEALDNLMQIEGMDIRALIRCVQKACSEALLTKSKVALPQEEIRNGQTTRPFGFIQGKE
jgi:ATP-dependent Lon protease